ncbi:MAG: glycosyltransferase family 39 protein [Planctomycetota bacterium]|nr:glycosyltransferase family 39 protein [Planctomycetota bacterium]
MKRYEIVLIAAALFAGLGVRLYFYTGLITSDDLSHTYASYRLVHPETQDSFQGVLQGSGNVRRLGVNVPIGLSMLVFGVHEWSLAIVPLTFSLIGIVVISGVCRLLAGPWAGVLGAWMWACLPADVYTATVCLQDNIFATVYATFLLFLLLSERSERRRWLWAVAAGLALGYMQYVKEVGWMCFGPLGLWAVYSTWARRRIDWRIVYIFSGFMLVQAAVGYYYWIHDADPLSYWKLTLGRLFSIYGTRTPTYPFPRVFDQAYKYLCKQWVLGYAVVAFPLLAIAALWSKRTPARALILLLLVAQVYIWLEATKWMNWTQRYTLQLSTLFIAITVAGLHALLSRLPERWGRRLVLVACLSILTATCTALQKDRQQHGRFRGEVIRLAFAYVNANASNDEPIYFDVNPHVPFYTKRAFEALSGFERFKGGFGKLEDAYEAKSGWVVLSHLEQGYMHLRPEASYCGPAPHWLEVFHASNNGGRYYARVLKILPEPPAKPIRIIDKPDYPADPPDVSRFEFEPISFAGAPALFKSCWKRASRSVDLEHVEDGLSCEVTGDPDSSDSQYGGVRFEVAGMQALRLNLSLTNAENVRDLYVYAYGRDKGEPMRWYWSLTPRQRRAALPNPLAFVTGEPSGYFRFGGEIPPNSIEEINVFIRIVPGTRAGFILHSAEVARFTAAGADSEEFTFKRVDLQAAPETERLSNRVGASKHVGIKYEPSGDVSCLVEGDPDSSQHQFGGVTFEVPGLDALRFSSSFINPQNIVGMWVDGCDEERRRIARWEWRLSPDSPASHEPTTHVLIPGESFAFLETDGERSGAAIRSVHVFIRLVPGTEAGFVLHSAEAAFPEMGVESETPVVPASEA